MSDVIADVGSAQADLDPSTDRYAARFSGPAGEWMLSVQTRAIREMMAPFKNATVLDVGGGHAQVARPLMSDGHDLTVLASTEAAFGQAVRLDPKPTLVTGDLLNPPFPDQSFDVVTAVRMMAHVGDWRSLIGGLCRIARRAVIIDFPIPGGVNALEPLFFGLKKRLEGDTRKFDTIKRSAVREAFEANGFMCSAEQGQFVLPMVIHRKLKSPGVSNGLERGLRGLGLDALAGTPVILSAHRHQDH